MQRNNKHPRPLDEFAFSALVKTAAESDRRQNGNVGYDERIV